MYEGDRIEKAFSYFDTGANDYIGTRYHYDAWNRIRAASQFSVSGTTETSFGPYTVQDFDWRGNVTATAMFETEPNWSAVASNANFASTTTSGRRALTKKFVDLARNVYKTEQYEVAANGSAGICAVTNTYRDISGRTTVSEQVGAPRSEVEYDTLGRQIRSQVKVGQAVVSKTETVYDTTGRAVEQHQYDLNAGETTGITDSSNNYTRRSEFFWFDASGRQTVQAVYGSGGPIGAYFSKPSRPTAAPTESSASCLVSKLSYSATTGRNETSTDPKDIVNKTVYDALGRTIATIANFKASGNASDENVEVQYVYNGLGNLVTLTAVNPTTGNQVTRYLYEDIYNVSLQTSAIYPDSNDTNSTDSDQVKTQYYLDGNVKQVTDQNGTVRQFAYDNQRRLVADAVTTLGSGVDGTVRKIGRTYDWNGTLSGITSHDASNAVLNEVRYEYDGNLNLVRLYQSHDGAVDVNTTPYLACQYADITKSFRQTAVVYPGGKALSYDYGATGTISDLMNHVASIAEGQTTLVAYSHSGGGSPMQTTYVEPGLSLTLAGGGLDRFGRIVNHGWLKNGSPLVHIVHGYDFAGNRLYRNDMLHNSNSERYEYDAINQIKSLERGTLNQNFDAVASPNHSESWNFDKTGNWMSYNKNGSTESRTHNAANEITSSGILSDANGNMTVMPGLKAKYDAWNRIVEVRDTSDNLIASYEYNGQNQRIKKTVGSTVTKSFFNEKWQELESTTGTELTACVWGLRYVDDLIYREKGAERLYSLTDPNWNVIAIADTTGTVVERLKYDAFGKATWMDEGFVEKAESEFDWNRTFTGQVLDDESGLMLYRNRFYHTGLGRFVSRDPIGYRAGDMNIYRYVGNCITISDPSGLGIYVDLYCTLVSSTTHRFSSTCEYECVADKSKDPANPKRGCLTGGALSTDGFMDIPDEFPTTYVTSVTRPWSCQGTLQINDYIENDVPTPGRNCSRSDCLIGARYAYDTARRACTRIADPRARASCETMAAMSLRATEWGCSKCDNP